MPLGELLRLPVIHMDAHVDGERVESTPEQWPNRHRHLIIDDRWIIDAMKLGVLGERLVAADP
jgi:hypothetical protein